MSDSKKSERYKVYAMMCGSIMYVRFAFSLNRARAEASAAAAVLTPRSPRPRSSIKTLRSALYSIVPIMATEMGLSEVQAGTLLTGFFPGYLITQMPAGPIVQRYGGKLTLVRKPMCYRPRRRVLPSVFFLDGLISDPAASRAPCPCVCTVCMSLRDVGMLPPRAARHGPRWRGAHLGAAESQRPVDGPHDADAAAAQPRLDPRRQRGREPGAPTRRADPEFGAQLGAHARRLPHAAASARWLEESVLHPRRHGRCLERHLARHGLHQPRQRQRRASR